MPHMLGNVIIMNVNIGEAFGMTLLFEDILDMHDISRCSPPRLFRGKFKSLQSKKLHRTLASDWLRETPIHSNSSVILSVHPSSPSPTAQVASHSHFILRTIKTSSVFLYIFITG